MKVGQTSQYVSFFPLWELKYIIDSMPMEWQFLKFVRSFIHSFLSRGQPMLPGEGIPQPRNSHREVPLSSSHHTVHTVKVVGLSKGPPLMILSAEKAHRVRITGCHGTTFSHLL